MPSIQRTYGPWLRGAELVFTVLFTIEYILRLSCVHSPMRYATSFFGVVDFLSVLPGYLSLFFDGGQSLLVIRGLRLLRIFRVLKLPRYVKESAVLVTALKTSRAKIIVFLSFVTLVVVIVGSSMYLIEGDEAGFTSIPVGMYWAVVTMTTVGYGDITPQTGLGRVLASVIMILGYAIIAVPTGIVSAELAHARNLQVMTRSCRHCSREGHDLDSLYCRFCGASFEEKDDGTSA